MKKRFLVSLLILSLSLLVAGSLSAQETYFGKNKVRYKDFEWMYIQTRHFDIYYYENAYPTAKFTADVLEEAYDEISSELNYKLQQRIPMFVYNSHNDFQQTNITGSYLPEGVGGFTEAFKKRMVVPFDGSYESYRHTLHHELTHAIVYDMLYGKDLSSLISRNRLFQPPLWLAEGYAEYSSTPNWDVDADMFVRDATINGYLYPLDYIGGYLAYTEGNALVKYIADKWGEERIGEMFKKGKIHLRMDRVLEIVLGQSPEDFFEDFAKLMKRRYWPEIAKRQEGDEFSMQLTKAREDGSFFNEKPVFSPDGDRIALFTDKNDYTEIVMISAADGKPIKRLVKASRSSDLESLHAYVSGMDFSPDGKSIVFATKSHGKESIFFVDVRSRDIYRKVRLDFFSVLSPNWSPDGKKVAFSGLKNHKRDLFVMDIESGEIEQITDDRYDDIDCSWLGDSKGLVFSSDRPHPETPVIDASGHPYVSSPGSFMPGNFEYGSYNLFRIDLDTKRADPLMVGPGANTSPKVSPDGTKVAFMSNRNGIDNMYVSYLDSTRYFAITNILGGIRSFDWGPEGKRIVFSAFENGAFDIFVMKDILPAGTDGVLEPTGFVLGEYNKPFDEDDESEMAGIEGETAEEPTDTTMAEAAVDSTVTDETMFAEAPPEDSEITDETAAVGPGDDAEAADSTGATSAEPVADSTEAVDDAEGETEDDTGTVDTGIYGDEYVHVAEAEESALDSVLFDVPTDSALFEMSYEEPAEFDSIPDRLPSGEFEIKKYKVKFTPDIVGGGFAYDTFFGVRGQTYFIFSDYLGNHQIYLATDIANSIDQTFIQAFYINNKRRINLGTGFFHTKNYYIYETRGVDSLFSDRFYGVTGFAQYPFSTFKRIELTIGQTFIDRKYHDRDPRDENFKQSAKVTNMAFSYVFDNVLWGSTGPVKGTRAKATIDAGKDIFEWERVSFYSLEFDYRKYWHVVPGVSMAVRFSGGASFGRTPKLYWLGGTTNWIGTRTLDPKVYEVNNLYFSSVVTPLRGQEIYDLSGDRYGLINWEFRFPLVQYFAMKYPLPIVLGNITGVAFYDMGAAWTKSDFRGASTAGGVNRLQDIKTGFGVGMRMNMFGLALLRFDVAWATDFHDVSDHPTTYFSIGADF